MSRIIELAGAIQTFDRILEKNRGREHKSRHGIIKLVADGPYGQNIFRPLRVLFDLSSQSIDVGVYVAFIAFVAGIPYRVEQVLPRVHLSRSGCEQLKNVEFDWCQ